MEEELGVIQSGAAFRSADRFEALVGDSPRMHSIKDYVRKVARADTNVLITGETGTGKELIAHAIHQLSPRRNRPMICLNCAAIPDTLLESELFGYEAGAFTGAQRAMAGKLQLAGDGFIFLDEIGDMSPLAQAKMLRALETREACRLGGQHGFSIRCRFLAATNQDLPRRVAEGAFRKDLFYRLSIARIDLPPLRERATDVPRLLDRFIDDFNAQFHADVKTVEVSLIDTLMEYEWPGNVRELRNLAEAMFLNLNDGDTEIGWPVVPEWFRPRKPDYQTSRESERARVIAALNSTRWNKSKAAGTLKWSRMTLYRKMARYQIRGPEDSVHSLSA